MFKSFKDTIKHSMIYGLGNISSKLVGFLLLPLYTNYLTTSEYGILAILEITTQIIVSVFSLNISTAMMRWSSEANNENEKKSIIFTSLCSAIVISLALFLILTPFNSNLSTLFFDTDKFSTYFSLLFIASSLGIYNLIPLTILRLREKSSFFAGLTTANFTLTLLLNFYFIAYKNMGVEGILLSQVIGQSFILVFSLPIVVNNIILKFKASILLEMISYGLPLVFSTIFTLAFTMSDRFIIKHIQGEASVGVYSLGHKIASVMNMLILQSFQLGFLPLAYKKLGDPDEKRFFSKTLTYYTLVLSIVALLISLFSKELIEFLAVNKDYWIAYSVVPIIAFAFVIKGIQYIFSLNFHYSKKTSYNALVSVISAIINISLNIIFVQHFGFVGAAYAMLISLFIMMLLSYYWGQKVYPIPFELLKVFKIVLIAFFLFSISLLTNQYELIYRIGLKVMLVLIFFLTIYKISIFNKYEMDSLKQGVIDFKNLFFKKNKSEL